MDTPRPQDRHVPVLLDRVVDLLAPALTEPGSVHVDATLGLGGHAEAVLERCPEAVVVGVDRDPAALELAGTRLARFGPRFRPLHAVYDDLSAILAAAAGRVDAILFDLGVSSMQLDEGERGFAYRVDAPLDMRMDQSRGRTAAEVLNTYAAGDLARVLKEYGEERYARAIANAVVRERERVPFATSARLVELLQRVIPAASRHSGGHPAKRTFQALRIEVNGELDTWARAWPAALDALPVGGRAAVLSYHSLEDRITKRELVARATSRAPRGLPVEPPGTGPELRLLTRGAEVPSPAEQATNPRSASARLRAAERTSPRSPR